MKAISLTTSALLLGLSATWAQQETFTIKGKVGSLDSPAKIYLLYQSGDESVQDSVVLKKGKFAFSGSADHAARGTLLLSRDGSGMRGSRDYFTVYLHEGTIKVSAVDSLANATIKGSKLNDDNQRLQAALEPTNIKMKALSARYQQASAEERKSEAFLEEYRKDQSAIREVQRAALLEFIHANPESQISLTALQQYGGAIPDVNVVEPLFSGLAESVRNSISGKAYALQLENIKLTEIGQSAPMFTQNDPDGKPVSLSDFKGKYVLIDFWASWCGPCRAENPHVVKAYEAYKDKNFTILGVSLDDEKGREAWLKAIKDDQLTWTQVSDLKGWKNEVSTRYAVRAIPQNFLVDPNGRIIAKNLRGDKLAETLAELLD